MQGALSRRRRACELGLKAATQNAGLGSKWIEAQIRLSRVPQDVRRVVGEVQIVVKVAGRRSVRNLSHTRQMRTGLKASHHGKRERAQRCR
jgi:hypothetical protein